MFEARQQDAKQKVLNVSNQFQLNIIIITPKTKDRGSRIAQKRVTERRRLASFDSMDLYNNVVSHTVELVDFINPNKRERKKASLLTDGSMGDFSLRNLVMLTVSHQTKLIEFDAGNNVEDDVSWKNCFNK